ncbi:NAD(P)-dependent dehydrogenase (short-subunit alcohol dehydrogenase family)/3-oxoacyl-(acyl-carrier-protein) synthase [Saccharothrix tamanrassetensis]|uniref:NAD(P)-dependent dehydrogenase (Short-subunit alcohol dehydrogenase family)/3-oxoacyl-(Acyl-carrier-protein) synthase n=1 Tax=Saccharothrix tamanrassetensis TaxID=1051531 RepID=A0A841CIC3_9PSEU|nr:SDR family oxidoreductase [Saccharothrix tamanrassetensis]MBB5957171.1 NAD(P)-dependent dehydrogenase (short-subunit alcohol dehydrogenase family)/3-oxoacyl-(acyl-carrier-protein) synthase [Saccharothrix tamanrassetensis]
MTEEFAGRVVLVTGGGKGVGRAIVREFAARGAHVVINYFHSGQAARTTQQEVTAAGGSSELIRASVAKPDDVTAMFEAVRQRTGRLDVLVNNAARGVLAPSSTLTDAEWQKVFDVNVHGARRCAWAALPLLSEAGGSVVNVSSIGAGMVVDNYAVIGVAKAALEALGRYLAVEFAPRGVRVNTASAGLLDNPTADLFPGGDSLRANCATNTPLGRLGTEEELAGLVTMLASPRATWITGQTVLADGGLSLGHAILRPDPPPQASAATASATAASATATAAAANGRSVPARLPQTSGGGPEPSAVHNASSPAPVPITPARTSLRRAWKSDDDAVDEATDDRGTVAVVGMGMVVPGADSPAEFWELLTNGRPVFGQPGERFRQESFLSPEPGVEDHGYTFLGGYIREPRLHREAKARSCAHDVAAQWLRHSIAQASEEVVLLPDDLVECFVGNTVEGNQHLDESLLVETALRHIAEHWPRSRTGSGAPADRLRTLLRRRYPFATGAGRSHLSDEVVRAAITDLLPSGSPYLTVDTACSSGLYAVDLGLKSILSGTCDIAVCGGVFTNTARFSIMFSALRGLSAGGMVRVFDQAADGTLFSDGAGAVVLKSLRRARRDGDEVLALLGGFGAASDGRGKAVHAPNPVGQEIAVRRARQVNGIEAPDVDWIVAHGTGTAVGDRVELGVLDALAPDAGYPCTSNKSLVGHTGWPAGVISLIHAVLGLRHDRIPAQRPLTEAAEDTRGERIHIPRSDLPLRRRGRARTVGVSAFGFGGTDAHLLVQDASPREAAPPRSAPPLDPDDVVLVGWSAHLPDDPSPERLRARLAAREPLTPLAAFPTPYPAPPARTLRMAPRTVRTVDRCQLMALAVAARFAEEHGALWQGVESRTGVLAAHTGPVGTVGAVAMRCYADDLLSLRAEPDDQVSRTDLEQAVKDCLDQVREERLPTNEDTLPGVGPNVIPARLANHLDLHGPALTLDTGTSSTYTAVHVASRYLATREVDLALVLALNGNSTPEFAALLGRPVDHLAEGAFLLALARKRDAAAKGWPVLCRVTTDPRPERAPAPARPSRERSYLGADGAVGLLSALADDPDEPVTVIGPFPGPAVTLHPVEERSAREAGRARPSAAVRSTTNGTTPVVPAPHRDPLTTRHVPRLEPQPLPGGPGEHAALPADCLVLTGEATATAIAAPAAEAAATVVVVRPGDDPTTVLESLSRTDNRYRHLRVYVPWTEEPGIPVSLLSLHEAMFLAAQRCESRLAAGGSLGVLLVDPMRRGAPGAHAGLFTGFVKSLSWELPGCACRAVLSDEPADTSWRALEAELGLRDGLPVTTYRSGSRYRERLCPAPPTPGPLPLQPGDVVVATGGARGITAAAVEGLLDQVPLKVWLLGSSSLSDVPADLLAAADDDLPGHRAEFIAGGLRAEDGSSVAELNRRFERLLHARESHLTLTRMRERCGDAAVHYLTCDVTDAAAVRAAVETVFRRDGRVDLLVNGAGRHHAGELRRKNLAEFRRIRDVKLRGYQNLKEAFSTREPRLWCNFGSVTGLVGLPGEVEYSSANDFLGCAATNGHVASRRDEYTVAWTVWDEVGLGGNAVIQSLVTRDQRLTAMGKKEGAAHFVAELAHQGSRDAVVTFIGARERKSFARQFPGYLADSPAGTPAGHFLHVPESRDADGATWRLVLDERHESLLRGHVVDGRPTVPGTMLAAIAAEAARALLPGETFRTVRDLSFSSWVRPARGRPAEFRVTAVVNRSRSAGARPSVLVRVTSDITTPRGEVLRRGREHFRATVPAGPPRTVRDSTAGAEGRPVRSPYYHPASRVLLTGPFRTTCEWSAGPPGASARWRPDPARMPGEFARLAAPSLLLDALVRTRALRPVAEDVHEVEVPRYIRRIEWCTDDNDLDLATRHPDGVLLRWDAVTNAFLASTPDGTVLARVEDAYSASMGRVRITDDHAARAGNR